MPAAPIVYTTRSIKRRRSAAHLNGRSHADCGFAYFHTLHIFCRELVVYDDAVLDHTGLTWILLFQTYLEKTVCDQLALEARTYRTDLMLGSIRWLLPCLCSQRHSFKKIASCASWISLQKTISYPSRLTLLPKEDPGANSSCESPKRISTSFPG